MRTTLAVTVLFAAAVASCGSDDESTTDTSAVADDVGQIEVLYDGETCTSTGPTELPAGDHSFVITNTTDDATIAMWVRRLVDDHTYQDLLDAQAMHGEPGTSFAKPSWVHATPQFTPGEVLSDHSYRYDHSLEPGPHAFVVGNNSAVWLCGGFDVVEA